MNYKITKSPLSFHIGRHPLMFKALWASDIMDSLTLILSSLFIKLVHLLLHKKTCLRRVRLSFSNISTNLSLMSNNNNRDCNRNAFFFFKDRNAKLHYSAAWITWRRLIAGIVKVQSTTAGKRFYCTTNSFQHHLD